VPRGRAPCSSSSRVDVPRPVDASAPLLVDIAVAVLLAFTFGATRAALRRTAVAAVLLNAGVLVAFVFGEDTYRDHGISRWDAYRSPGGALGVLFIASVAGLLLVAAVLAYAEVRRSPRLFRAGTLSGIACALFLVVPTVIGFSTN
jgi:hypothetical protein